MSITKVDESTAHDSTLQLRDDQVLAQRLFDGDESLVSGPKAAAWLADRASVQHAYMELFDWENLSILAALRDFCGRLILKGETQQISRILEAVSIRWCACNADHGFKSKDVVYTICYSILLLNTDLHMAGIERKMTRAQFVKNTLTTIRSVVVDAAWESQIEIVLKDLFNSIRYQPLPLHTNESKDAVEPPPTDSRSTLTSSMLHRTPSILSKAGSEHMSFRGRPTELKFTTSRRASKNRSRPRHYPSAIVGSSRTSLEDQSSVWTPSASSIWSKHSFGKTQTPMSVNSNSSSIPQGDHRQSIGFANALSQAIIREDGKSDTYEDNLHETPLLDDESLELAGAPWAKEGIVQHKHHLEAMDKKARDRKWTETFAVIEKGWMRLFSFNRNANLKHQKSFRGVVGGGNWIDNAEELGKFQLRQTIASALPPPGYSETRQHVWALSLPNGAVHLFQVGTPEIVVEFVTTANYWSARLSKQPLLGAVSNFEYGWSESIINSTLSPTENRPPSNSGAARPNLERSIRSSIDQRSVRPEFPGDRISINNWAAPQQSMVASVLLEVDQLKALSSYVGKIEEELQKHNDLRSTVSLAFSPGHPNSTRAMANWKRKSSYLLKEIVKFRTYIDCLQAAQARKEAIQVSK